MGLPRWPVATLIASPNLRWAIWLTFPLMGFLRFSSFFFQTNSQMENFLTENLLNLTLVSLQHPDRERLSLSLLSTVSGMLRARQQAYKNGPSQQVVFFFTFET